MKLAVHGATGRMGLAVARLAHADEAIRIVGAACGPGDAAEGKDLGELAGVGNLGVEIGTDVAASLLGADVVIDFSVAQAVKPLVAAATREGVALVSGTTNLDDAAAAVLDEAATKIAVLWAPNMSFGVQVLCEIVQHAVERLGLDYDVEIVETHHRRKVDAPSGTARRLANVVKGVRANLREVSGREGEVGARTDDEMAVLSLRGGDVIGDHTVHLIGAAERLELTHRATSRDLFALGALRAARYVHGKPQGRYTISDVLG